ncbi:calcium channel flower [Eurytemora carolleeae]|uniref:calcium channel flower n=1 Tax=Eurytemora carolleeae TaxID=1294199 RepID=UPI000C75C839|nr:calcium channel flower [Eurytemora carolleeae]|eukprot:XP_023333045.1 calcium channel flower-like [Eurytemora affinis]
MFLEPVKKFAIMVENRPPWQKSILYVTLAIPPLFLCFGFSTLIGSGALAGTGILYGMQTIGKKASNAEMAAAARGNTEPDEKNIMDDSDWQSNP